ncbi:hypothetical protein DRH14_05155 [Candidatus Shapirobacteria bacterium]|nr:MAG: hypothetical protein DRH14_05155 [Candidatus Shapirobacteria bacterium]
MLSKEAQALLKLLGDRPVAYHPQLARILGGVKEALFVSQMLYWQGKGRIPDGWIWKTRAEWTEETGLSRWEQETARKNLCRLGVLEEKRQGIPAKLYYRLNLERLHELIVAKLDDLQQDGGDTTNKKVGEALTTPENTSQTTSNNALSLTANAVNDKAAKPPSLQQYFEDTIHRLHHCENGKQAIAIAKGFCDYCFGIDAPYGRVGRLVKQAGGAARFCQLCLEVLAKSPRGDPLSYITALLRNKKLETPRASPQTPRRTGPREPNWELLRGIVYDFEYAKHWIMTHYPPERWATFVEGVARGEDADPSKPGIREWLEKRDRQAKEQAHV